MKRLEKIKLIENPKEEVVLDNSEMSSLLGGENLKCPGTYNACGLFYGDYCSSQYSEDGSCGSASDYCSSYKSCRLWFTA